MQKMQKTQKTQKTLHMIYIKTVLGQMIAIADDVYLYLLDFVDRKGVMNSRLGLGPTNNPDDERVLSKAENPSTKSRPLLSIEAELTAYFAGSLIQFKTPYKMFGSPFQQKVWQSLCKIPYGETKSYADQAKSLGNPRGYRAVANANGANKLAIIIPCHRVIRSTGQLGGYGGGIAIKQWLIYHEKKVNSRLGLGPTNNHDDERFCNKAENHALCEGKGSSAKSIYSYKERQTCF